MIESKFELKTFGTIHEPIGIVTVKIGLKLMMPYLEIGLGELGDWLSKIGERRG
jgi:hypothetical protein